MQIPKQYERLGGSIPLESSCWTLSGSEQHIASSMEESSPGALRLSARPPPDLPLTSPSLTQSHTGVGHRLNHAAAKCRCAAKCLLVPEQMEQRQGEEYTGGIQNSDSSKEILLRQRQTGIRSQVPNTSKIRPWAVQEADGNLMSQHSVLHPANSPYRCSSIKWAHNAVSKKKGCVSDYITVAHLAALGR